MSSRFLPCILSNDHSVLCEVDPFPQPVLVTASFYFVIPSTLLHVIPRAAECHGLKQTKRAYEAEGGEVV